MILVLSKGVALGRSNSSDRPLTAAGTLDSVQILRSTQVEASSRTLRSDEPPMMAIWERADSCAVAEVQCNAASSASSLVEFKRLVGLLMFSGGFGIQQCQSHTPRLKQLPSYIFPSWVYSPPSDLPFVDLRATLRAMYTEQAAAVRADLLAAYHSTFDDHCQWCSATSPRTLS